MLFCFIFGLLIGFQVMVAMKKSPPRKISKDSAEQEDRTN